MVTIKKDEGSKSKFTEQVKDASILGTPYVFEASSLSNGVTTSLKLKADQVFTPLVDQASQLMQLQHDI